MAFSLHELIQHVSTTHEKKKPFKCDICDYICSQKSDMKRHVKSVHEGKRPFKCDICNASFAQKEKLKSHILSVHEGKKTVPPQKFYETNTSAIFLCAMFLQ